MANKALLIGINYTGTENELRGCVNDIKHINSLLLKNNYDQKNITIISDAHENADFEPSRENILAQIKKLIKESKPGDTLFLHYSGHGTYSRDLNNDEADGRDEAICPASGDNISDDELKQILNELPQGVKLFGLMDCCHSGSIYDLENNLDKPQTATSNKIKHGYAVMLSGCQDNQTSADAYIEQKNQGALTASFLKRVQLQGFKNVMDVCFSNSKSKMRDLRDKIYKWLKQNGFTQKPNIAFEGLLPATATAASTPILSWFGINRERTMSKTREGTRTLGTIEGLKVGKYNLRDVPSRSEIEYETIREPLRQIEGRVRRRLA